MTTELDQLYELQGQVNSEKLKLEELETAIKDKQQELKGLESEVKRVQKVVLELNEADKRSLKEAQEKLDSVNQEIKGANAELAAIKEELDIKRDNFVSECMANSDLVKKCEALHGNISALKVDEDVLTNANQSLIKQREDLEKELEFIKSTIRTTREFEKELLAKAEHYESGIRLLRGEEEAQVLLTQEAKLKKEKLVQEAEALETLIKQEEAKLKETDEALLSKGAELSTVTVEVNEKLQVLQIAEQKLEQKKKQLDKEILNAKAEKLIK